MWRAIASNAMTLFIVFLLAVGVAVIWAKDQYSAEGPLASAICLRVESGTNMNALAERLADQGAISNLAIFRAGAEYSGKSSQLKAGSFLIQPGTSMEGIINTVTASGRSTCGTEINFRIGVLRAEVKVRELDPETSKYVEIISFDPAEEAPEAYVDYAERGDTRYRVTLAEGVTSWQVVQELRQAEFLEGSLSAMPDEGSLAPDSYEVKRGSERQALVDRMTAAQSAVLAEAWEGRAEGLPLNSPEEALILASIVEKETGLAEERPQVASVFVNRLRKGMLLQTDPTVIYGVTEGRGNLGRGIRQSELDRETPYNTYVIKGLPPTPIANPGRAAIEAALNPDTTEYIFFVADGTGGHAFAKTLREHNNNVAEWRKIEAERAKNQ
ncbi:endolytic transglycosylase MltG [Actibacterium pelagium]|uniref:Endolytic murein transglycosylase n=1 Tax=Actibacterium pelagium TaxID=2029103 RepID=A0A917ACM2_9RHOB|nr:endolytic transglycosylase MltG [Actibacterium pelagium]GGE40476.1 branched-chain alpha-keto acid dehydrogenase subunit E2 [Actibacterium pelagium]